ncbi:HNH endonuclease [Dethiosulfatibacter aminovorans]|uniref:HNH endonuclease n=1 Tax=Dethiosulfatibacter aminovorans TaxID=332095 RepID=UPI001587E6F1|nr:HNH endonuclease signature motif containing protein [Dethiosulfatibacter aminovorans]
MKPEEVAPYFYRFMVDNEDVKNLAFADKGKEDLRKKYDVKKVAYLIRVNPMRYWGKFSCYRNGEFWFELSIPSHRREEVYEKTRFECIARVEKELDFKIDTMINLKDEYEYRYDESKNMYISESEREGYVKQRLTQGKFRNRLLERFDDCIICGIENKNLLVASHIKPWKKSNNSERVDVNNGLLLCPNHDKLFDKGWISFNGEGSLILSPKLSEYTDNKKLMIESGISCEFSHENYQYLSYHRNEIFMK